MATILDATVELLRLHRPDEVGVRDIAERSGHNQRFVVEWFGSKVELFRQAFLRLADELRDTIQVPITSSTIPSEFVVIVRLMNWLVANDPGVFRDATERPLLELMAAGYRQRYGLDERLSELLAQRLVAGAVSTILFGDALRMTPEDLQDQVVLEARVASLLARHGLTD